MKLPPHSSKRSDGDPDSAKQLLAGGVDINLHYKPDRWTALHIVVEEMVVDSTRGLLENGADPNQKDTSGWTPPHLAIDAEGDSASQRLGDLCRQSECRKPLCQPPMVLARRYKHARAVHLLQEYGAND